MHVHTLRFPGAMAPLILEARVMPKPALTPQAKTHARRESLLLFSLLYAFETGITMEKENTGEKRQGEGCQEA